MSKPYFRALVKKSLMESCECTSIKKTVQESTLDEIKSFVRYLKDKGYEKVYGTWTPRRINGQSAEYNFMFMDDNGQCWNFMSSDFRWTKSNILATIRKTSGPRDFYGERNITVKSIDDLKRLGL